MKIRPVAPLLLSLVVSLGMYAASPVLSFEGAEAVVTVPAGHRVAWVYGYSAFQKGIVADSDNDGQVRFTPPSTSSVAVVDVETGEWAVAPAVRGSVLQPPSGWGIDADVDGHFSIYDASRAPNRGMLWLRPGVGAWTPPAEWENPLAVARDFVLVDISTFLPVGASPPAPSGVLAGDSFMYLEGQNFLTGLVDFSISNEYAGRLYFEDWTAHRVEGRTVTVDVIRRLGTDGTISTTCAPSFRTNTIGVATKAVAGVDYAAFDEQPVTFGPGEVVKQCSYTLLDDGVYTDLPRYFLIGLTPATGGAIVDYYGGVQTVLIDDDDPVPTLQFGAVPASVVESDVDQTVNVPWSLAGSFRGEIKVKFESVEHVLTPGDTARTSPVVIQGNDSPNETQTIELRVKPGYAQSRIQPVSRNLTVLDDDAPTPKPEVTLSAAAIVEGSGGAMKEAPVRMQLPAALQTTEAFTLFASGGTATSGADYAPFQTVVTFAPGETEKIITVSINPDTAVEADESIVITASSSHWGTMGSTTLMIRDDDATSSLSIADTTVVEKTGSSAQAAFRITFSKPPAAAGTVQYKTIAGTAKAGSDFASANGTLQYSAGQSLLTLSVEVFGDATTEQDEKFSVELSNPSGGVSLARDRASATIYDDDAAVARPSLAIDDVEVRESDGATEATFALRLSKAPTGAVTVSYETADDSATAAADYGHRSGVVTFAAGETTKTIVVPITGDDAHEESEAFTVVLSNGSGAIVADTSAVCTILDDDPERTKRRSSRH